MFGVTEMRSQAGAQFGLVNKFVRRRHVLKGKLRSQERPINIRRIALAQKAGGLLGGAAADGGQGRQRLSLLLVRDRDLVGGEIESFGNLLTVFAPRPMPVQIPN